MFQFVHSTMKQDEVETSDVIIKKYGLLVANILKKKTPQRLVPVCKHPRSIDHVAHFTGVVS